MPNTSSHYWIDPTRYVTHLPEHIKPPWDEDDWISLVEASRRHSCPYTQHRRTIVLSGIPKPEQVHGFVGLIKEIYNSPTRTWLRKHDTVVVFFMDTDDTYLGVKVAASLCGLRWRHR